ncbi:hypothetical protein RUND412_000285 [Rhizina undulata]
MGWWKSLQDTLHPPPPRRRPPRNPDHPEASFLPTHEPSLGPDDVELVELCTDSAANSPRSSRISPWQSSEKIPFLKQFANSPRAPRICSPLLKNLAALSRRYFVLFLVTFVVVAIVAGVGSLFAMPSARIRILEAHYNEIPGNHDSVAGYNNVIAGDNDAILAEADPGTSAWERFEFLKNYYKGMFSLVEVDHNIPEPDAVKGSGRGVKSKTFSPYPDYENWKYKDYWKGDYEECSFDDENTNISVSRGRPEIRAFSATPEGMPDPVFGSHDILGIDDGICFDRYGRLGPYGYGYPVSEGGLGTAVFDGGDSEKNIETGWGPGNMPFKKIDWRGVNWDALQSHCLEKNKSRFRPASRSDSLFPGFGSGSDSNLDAGSHRNPRDDSTVLRSSNPTVEEGKSNKPGPQIVPNPNAIYHPRTAVLLRGWIGYKFTPNDIASLRFLVTELSLLSGAEYSVHLLIHVEDSDIPIWASESVYKATIEANVPQEFWGITELWSESMMETIYKGLHGGDFNGLPLHGVYRSTFMPIQWFAHRHPEYEFFWNWELDIRNTGHNYRFFEAAGEWAKRQPRKYLWERNERFYVPAIHGSWEEFSKMVEMKVLNGSAGNNTIWGPVPVDTADLFDTDLIPPFDSPEVDVNATWGVGEDADLIVFNPLFNPEGTDWGLRDDTSGYGFPLSPPLNDQSSPHVSTPPPTGPPRRTAIVAASRLSRRLLLTMHRETAEKGHSMFSEMWPASCALHHGLKAVYAPHPVYIDRDWPVEYLESVFNNGVNGTTGGRIQSVFGSREHNFRGSTWYYNAGFSGVLWRRWLGQVVDGAGGEEWERREGRMCLKAALLHPIKEFEEEIVE